MAAAFAAWLKENAEAGATARTSASSSAATRAPAASGCATPPPSALTASGVEVIDLDIVTTPGVAMMVKHLGADAGMIATASHNPIQWNGLKFLNRDSRRPAAGRDARAARRQLSTTRSASRRTCASSKLRPAAAANTRDARAAREARARPRRRARHLHQAIQGRARQRERRRLRRHARRCSTSSAASSSTSTPRPTASSPTSPSRPRRTSRGLADEVNRQKAAVGFAQDPDADRLAIVDENGAYIGEEYSLALCRASWILSQEARRRRRGEPLDQPDDRRHRRAVRRAASSARPSARPTSSRRCSRENAVIGGEGNGGVIDPRIVPGRDSLVGMAYVLQLMADDRQDDQPARRRAAALRDRQDEVRVPPRGRRTAPSRR